MKICLLAAGKSSRIYKKIFKPKCLLKIDKQTIIQKLVKNFQNLNVKNISIVVGFKKEKIINNLKKFENIKFIFNKEYNRKDMLSSLVLFLKKNKNDDVIISYTDIIYNQKIIKKLITLKNKNITIPILYNWKKIWNIRKKKIKEDGETLKIDKSGNLKEIGKKIFDENQTKYQFMGIIYIPQKKINYILNIYKNLDSDRMQTTSFLNHLLEKKIKVSSIKYKDFWFEFDDYEDFKSYKKFKASNV